MICYPVYDKDRLKVKIRSSLFVLYIGATVVLNFRVVLNSVVLIDSTACKLCAGVPHNRYVGEVATRHGELADAIYADLQGATLLNVM